MKASRRDWGNNRLQNNQFFLKISKEIGKAGRKSFSRLPQSRYLFSLSFRTFCSTARAYFNTQKYGTVLQSRGIKVDPNKLKHDHLSYHFFPI